MNLKKNIKLLPFIVLTIYFALSFTFFNQIKNSIFSTITIFIIIIRPVILITIFVLVLKYLNDSFKKVIISTTLFFELFFTLVPISMGTPSFQMLNWIIFFDRPINEADYRDYDLIEWENSTKKILIVGDSYTAGNGVKFIKNRYDKLLESKLSEHLKEEYSVRIAANPDWGITEQFDAIKTFPYKPDILVYQYYINDLDDFINNQNTNINDKNPYFEYFPLFGKLTSSSNFLYNANTNWFYNALKNEINNTIPHSIKDYSEDFIQKVDSLIIYCSENNIKMYVLLIPELKTLSFGNETFINELINLFEQNDIPTINPTEELKKLTISERVVNRFDAHAGKKTNLLFSYLLYNDLFAQINEK